MREWDPFFVGQFSGKGTHTCLVVFPGAVGPLPGGTMLRLGEEHFQQGVILGLEVMRPLSFEVKHRGAIGSLPCGVMSKQVKTPPLRSHDGTMRPPPLSGGATPPLPPPIPLIDHPLPTHHLPKPYR